MSSILVTCRSKPAALKNYVPALRLAGWQGGVVILSPGDSIPLVEIFSGLLLTGGADIHPQAWDAAEALHARAETDAERDELEFHAVQEAWRLELPILGICRGEQVLNVALGGSLHQHVPEVFSCPEDRHRHGSSEGTPELWHSVTLDPASRLGGILGATQVEVNSRHHQAVKRVAAPLRPVAWHDDTRRGDERLVEAVEAVEAGRWTLGVQWHPENLVGLDNAGGQAARKLFKAFVDEVVSRS